VALEDKTYTGKSCSVSSYRSGASKERGKPPCKCRHFRPRPVPNRDGGSAGYGGEIIEESHDRFPTIAAAGAQGAERLEQMNAVDRAGAARGDSTTMRAAGAGDGRTLRPAVKCGNPYAPVTWVRSNSHAAKA
jgi:hypothetical protein